MLTSAIFSSVNNLRLYLSQAIGLVNSCCSIIKSCYSYERFEIDSVDKKLKFENKINNSASPVSEFDQKNTRNS